MNFDLQRILFDSDDHKPLTAREAREMERQRREFGQCDECSGIGRRTITAPVSGRSDEYSKACVACNGTGIRCYVGPSPPYSEPTTSRAAAEALVRNESERARVLEFIRFRGSQGATREEIGQALDLAGDTLRPRVWELMAMKLIRESGETRKTAKGRDAKVIVATG